MKDIKEYLLEQKGYWTNKDIKIEDLLKIGTKALKDAKETAADIMDEISQYEDPDDLEDAWENDRLTHYKNWEDKLTELLFNDDKYSSKEGDIADEVWIHSWDVLSDLETMEK